MALYYFSTESVTAELSPVTTELATSETSPEVITPEARPATTEAVTFDLATAETESNVNVGLVVGVVMGACVALLVVMVAIVLIVITRRKTVRLRSSMPQEAAEEIDARYNTTHNLHDEVKIDTKPPPASKPDTALNIPVQANAAYIPTPSIPTEANAAYISTGTEEMSLNELYATPGGGNSSVQQSDYDYVLP